MLTTIRRVLPVAGAVLLACSPQPHSDGGPAPAAPAPAPVTALVPAPAPAAPVLAPDTPTDAAADAAEVDPFSWGTCGPNECDDGNPCTRDLCHKDNSGKDKHKKKCKHEPLADGTGCSDGNACTQTDTCQQGVCIGANPVTCAPPTACRQAGVCNAGTGQCEYAAVADGTGCNDGNACTQTDTCQQGVCAGANPVTCAPPTACHQAGVCNAGTGQCEYAAVADGTGCSDGNACTQTDTCQQGVCIGANPVTCAPPIACHQAGACNAGTGQCEYAVVADGTGCSDGNACTQTDTCQQGVCAGANPVTCGPPSECHLEGVCNSGTGSCSYLIAPDGTACSNGTCQSGVCTPTPASLRVEVYDKAGAPLPGASVEVAGSLYLTNDAGAAQIDSVAPGSVVAAVSKDGYAPASAVVDVSPNSTNRTIVRLLAQGQRIALNALNGGDVVRDDVRVSFPPSSIVDSAGVPVLDGIVQVSVVELNPMTAVPSELPGPLIGVPTSGNPGPLGSVMMADISLWRGREPLRLAPNAYVPVEFVLPDPLQGAFSTGQEIPAWWYDVKAGVWRQEGQGSIQPSTLSPGKQAWVAYVNHFTWWNVDFLLPVYGTTYNCIKAKVVDDLSPTLLQVSGTVRASGQTARLAAPYTTKTTLSSPPGEACLDVPYNAISQLSVSTTDPYKVPIAGFDLLDSAGGYYTKPALDLLDAHHPTQGGCAANSPCAHVQFRLSPTAAVQGNVVDATGIGWPRAKVFIQYDVGDGPVTLSQTTSDTGHYCLDIPARPGVGVIVYAAGQQTINGPYLYGKSSSFEVTAGEVPCPNFGGSLNLVQPIILTANPLQCVGPTEQCAPQWNVEPNIQTPGVSSQTTAHVAADSAGNVYVTGSFRGAMNFPGCPNLSSRSGSTDIFLARLDSASNCVWARSFGSAGTDEATALAVDSAGNVIITGDYDQSVTIGSTVLPPPSIPGGVNGFVAKFNSTGTNLWSFQISGDGFHYPTSVAVDQSPNYRDEIVVAGYYNGQLYTGPYTAPPATNIDGFTFFVTPTGAVMAWIHVFGGPGTERVTKVAFSYSATGPGDVFMTGDFNSTFNNFDDNLGLTPDGSTDGFVALLRNRSQGSTTAGWIRKFGGGSGDLSPQSGIGLAVNPATNDVFVTGVFSDTLQWNGAGPVSLGSGGEDVLLAKLSSAGNLSWLRTYGSSDVQRPTDLAITPNTDLLMTGLFRGTFTFSTSGGTTLVSPNGHLASFMTRINSSNGDPKWARDDGAPGGDLLAASVAVTGLVEGQPYMALITTGPTGSGLNLGAGALPWTGGQDLVVAKFLP